MQEIDNIEVENEVEKERYNFFETPIGKFVDSSLNVAISTVFPALIDDQIINIKDALITGGFDEGLREIKRTGSLYSDTIKGIATGEFKSIEQMRLAVKDGGILDLVSICIDKGLLYIENKTKIEKDVVKMIRAGKNVLINQLSSSIEKKYSSQLEHIEKLSNYCDKWKESFDNKDLEGMNRCYKQIKAQKKGIIQIENIIKKANEIENIQKIVTSSGNFDLSEEELKLASKI